MKEKHCSLCGEEFQCGAGGDTCWCAALPRVMPLDFTGDCLCPRCLERAIGDKIAESSQNGDPLGTD
ncbi:MAG: cysteine-rich CWC family protein [Deltaproteobacteria bacterium]